VEQRLNLPDRLQRADLLQQVMRIWLVDRPDTVIGAYWPIKGEFDPLPALHRWKEDGELLDEPSAPHRPAGGEQAAQDAHLPRLVPRLPDGEDAYGIPKPKDTELIVPTLLFVPCVGYGPAATAWATAAASTTAPWPRCSPALPPWAWATPRATWTTSSPRRTTCRWTPSQ
jgi:5-formyltetrahydrofolate cyclo-ligase